MRRNVSHQILEEENAYLRDLHRELQEEYRRLQHELNTGGQEPEQAVDDAISAQLVFAIRIFSLSVLL